MSAKEHNFELTRDEITALVAYSAIIDALPTIEVSLTAAPLPKALTTLCARIDSIVRPKAAKPVEKAAPVKARKGEVIKAPASSASSASKANPGSYSTPPPFLTSQRPHRIHGRIQPHMVVVGTLCSASHMSVLR